MGNILAALPPSERLKRTKTANDHLVVATRVDTLPHGTPRNIALLRRHFVDLKEETFTTADSAAADEAHTVRWETNRGRAEALARLAEEVAGDASPQRLLDWVSQKSAGGIVGALLQLVQEARDDGARRRDTHRNSFPCATNICHGAFWGAPVARSAPGCCVLPSLQAAHAQRSDLHGRHTRTQTSGISPRARPNCARREGRRGWGCSCESWAQEESRGGQRRAVLPSQLRYLT
jgi:hypothetical protein